MSGWGWTRVLPNLTDRRYTTGESATVSGRIRDRAPLDRAGRTWDHGFMLKLFENPASGNCYKVRLLLHHLGRPVERIFVDVAQGAERPAALLRLSPTGRVPLLELEEGVGLSESNAILNYLAEGTPYLPGDALERARVLGWTFFEQNLHEPHIATRRYWVALAEDSSPRKDQLDFWLESGNRALATMDRELQSREFFGSDRYTIADIALFAYTHVAEEGGFDLGHFPAIGAWMERVREQPGFLPMT